MTNAASRSRPSCTLPRRGLVAGLFFAAMLLPAHAGSGHTQSIARRCDPPPCPAKTAVKSQQSPSVWSGSTKPTDGNTTNKGGPIH